MSSKENLYLDNITKRTIFPCFTFFVFFFYKGNRKHFFRVTIDLQKRLEELEIALKIFALLARVLAAIS